MTKAELGTKRLCPNCGARYYDLNRSPIVCPKCGTLFEAAAPARARSQPAAKVVKPAVEEDVDEKAAVELVTLEEADDEAAESGAVKVAGEDDEVEDDDDEEDNTFLADDEEDEDEDVGDIIGDVDEEDT